MKDLFNLMDGALRRNLGCWTRELRLKGLMIIAPENEATETWLELLEAEGYLPPTVSWLNRSRLKVRLYKCLEEVGSFDLIHNDIHLCIENGPAEIEFLPTPEERLADYHRFGKDPAMLAVNPAPLPKQSLEFLRMLKVMDAWSPYSDVDDWRTTPLSSNLQ